MQVKIKDLIEVYENYIKRNVKNKKKLFYFEKNKMEYLCDIKRILENNLYNGGKYNIFIIFKPKVRVIMSQNIYDKVINHYVTRYILIPKLSKYLNERNCATRKDMGTSYALNILINDIKIFKRLDNFYFLKLDIAKYFYSIDHKVLLRLLENDLDYEECVLVKKILSSTNHSYINNIISKIEVRLGLELPKYDSGKGLPIGNMTSQFLAILYLAKLQHFIRHNLHLKYVNYMDDYVIIHENKEYLKYCLKVIEEKLKYEYKLELNKNKTKITNSKEGVVFLGYHFKVIKHKLVIHLASKSKQNIKKGLKRTNYLYKQEKISFKQMFSSIENYRNSYKLENKKLIENIIDFYWRG